jgi:FAD:protein FMN transferase
VTAVPGVSRSVDPATRPDTDASFRAMAGAVTVRIGSGSRSPDDAIAAVAAVFQAVEKECTRFDEASPLMRANAAGESWHRVPRHCYAALRSAAAAHLRTGGMFDPRVLSVLREIGYDRSLPFGVGDVVVAGVRSAAHSKTPTCSWRPRFDPTIRAVAVGAVPVDLGGIGKGLAVGWAAQAIADSCPSFLIEAGGDCYLAGDGPSGVGWQVAVEDPRGGDRPVAVLSLRDTGCATSSIRVRHWTVDGRPVHHLIDPRTGQPGGAGLLAVTVVEADPAMAEVWSKALFLAGAANIANVAAARQLRALWVTEDGTVGMSEPIAADVIWQAG